MTFCTSYNTHCTFGGAMRYASMGACMTMFDGFAMTKKDCVTMHLGFVSMRMGMSDYEEYQTMHCPHATGMGPCM